MRFARAAVFVPVMFIFWIITDLLIQVAYTVFPAQDTVFEGHFTIGTYRFDIELFAILAIWAGICVFLLLKGLFRLLVRGATFRAVIPTLTDRPALSLPPGTPPTPP